MADLDPFEMLVRLGKITQAQLQAAELVASAVGTSTCAARLVAIGVDKDKLLEALAELTRMPIAPADALAAAAPMKLPPSYGTTMKELLAVPIGRVDEHILDVAIADPRTSRKLRDAAIAHRPRLALESDVLAALARVFPDIEVLDPLHEPTLKNVPLAPRPVSVNDGAAHDVHDVHDEGSAEPAAPPPPAPQPVEIAGEQIDQLPPATSSPPFALTPVQTEVTKRVRARRDRDDHGATSSRLRLPPVARELAHAVRERADAFADAVRSRADARTLGIAISIAVIVAAAVLGFVVCASPASPAGGGATDDGRDAGAATVDAGDPSPLGPSAATPTATSPAAIEKPKVERPPKPPRKPTRRPHKKRR